MILKTSKTQRLHTERLTKWIRTLETEHKKASKKYFSSVQVERDKSLLEEDIRVVEDSEAEDLEEEIVDLREIIKTIDKQNDTLKSGIQRDMFISESPKESEERWKESKDRLERNKANYEKNEEKKVALEQLGIKKQCLVKRNGRPSKRK